MVCPRQPKPSYVMSWSQAVRAAPNEPPGEPTIQSVPVHGGTLHPYSSRSIASDRHRMGFSVQM